MSILRKVLNWNRPEGLTVLEAETFLPRSVERACGAEHLVYLWFVMSEYAKVHRFKTLRA